MIIDEDEAKKRLNSPLNLINQLKSRSINSSRPSAAMSLFGIGRAKEQKELEPSSPTPEITSPGTAISPTIPIATKPTLDQILENNDSQIKLGLAHDNALALLNKSVELLASKLDDIKADKLPATISAASKVVESIRKERTEALKSGINKEVHYHFYTPQQRDISEFEVIEVQ
jgi:hypothetical protein